MAEFAENLNPETFNRVREELLGQGVPPRVAEGRARRVAMVEYNRQHGEEEPAGAATRPPEGGDGQAAAPAAAAPAAPAAPAAAPGAPMAASVAVAAPAAPLTAPPPTGKLPTPKAGAPDKHRLLALVQPEGVQRVEREQGDRINTFPHLLLEELLSLVIVTAALIVFSTFVNAPLRELANPNLTPNPSKAPWYFLGLQELLRYFHPMVAGVLVPTLFFAFLFALPYADRNPSSKPGDRKLAIVLFTMLLMFFAVLTIIGAFFRGPGFNFIWPWVDGVFFDL
ncbi:MAG TPA: menaquinol-cytochrome c reductase cytochrome b subunit [Actinomycetota bacterium]|nr:menaquinol-cytochrome c reductase cytochrome b subunit [Actinomycetota bacterium]